MIFAFLTLLSALSLATVAGWFSIIGITTIYAGAPLHALIMGVVLECSKLVTTSWLYRNWEHSSLKLKIPLILFTLTLMLTTSIGVFGFLSKSHLEQNAGTIDNGGKIERLDQQISREKSTIADSDKVISQLDATINSFIGKDRADRALAVRRSQASQRKELRSSIEAAQKRIDEYSDEKLKLESEVRKLQLEVGPIRYIAELIYGNETDASKKIESAVKIFTLIIVSTLDPLAVILLVAANQTLMSLTKKTEKKEEILANLKPATFASREEITENTPPVNKSESENEIAWPNIPDEYKTSMVESTFIEEQEPNQEITEEPEIIKPTKTAQGVNNLLIKGIIGNHSANLPMNAEITFTEESSKESLNKTLNQNINDKYPKSLSWLNEFKRS
jgi:hypothetical protein